MTRKQMQRGDTNRKCCEDRSIDMNRKEVGSGRYEDYWISGRESGTTKTWECENLTK